jgi:hypothetical protein
MLRLASDADVHGDIPRGLRRRLPIVDLIRVQDALPEGTHDNIVLAWASTENRVLISNDRNTMVGFAYQRAARGEPMPGLIVTTNEQSIGSAIDDLAVIAEYMPEEEVRD